MGKFKIKISYETGDSFGSENTTDYLELVWQNIDVAKDNLIRIKEHYEMYSNVENCRTRKEYEKLFDENKEKKWFVYQPQLFCISSNQAIDEKQKKLVGDGNWEYRPDRFYATHCIKLITDNGKYCQISAFWCGYFEKLHEAEIEVDINNNDMKFVF